MVNSEVRIVRWAPHVDSVFNRIRVQFGLKPKLLRSRSQYLFQWQVVKRKWFMVSLLTIDCSTTYTLRFEMADFTPSTTQATRAGLIRFPTHVKTQD